MNQAFRHGFVSSSEAVGGFRKLPDVQWCASPTWITVKSTKLFYVVLELRHTTSARSSCSKHKHQVAKNALTRDLLQKTSTDYATPLLMPSDQNGKPNPNIRRPALPSHGKRILPLRSPIAPSFTTKPSPSTRIHVHLLLRLPGQLHCQSGLLRSHIPGKSSQKQHGRGFASTS